MKSCFMRLGAGIFLLILCGCNDPAPPKKPSAPATQVVMSSWSFDDAKKEADLTWRSARVYLPFAKEPVSPDRIPATQTYPVVLFMHGCWGFETVEHGYWGKFLASHGMLVIMPDSFARPGHRRACDPVDNNGGSQPEVHDMRLAEIAYAKNRIEQSAWFDGKNLFLIGYSEGAIAAVRTPIKEFNGVISLSWTCTHRGYPPLHGIRLPKETPLLSIAYQDDPWFPFAELDGNCGQYMSGRPDAQHITLPSQGEMHRLMYKFDRRLFNLFNTNGHDHGTFQDEHARNAVLAFIHARRGRYAQPGLQQPATMQTNMAR